WEHLVKRNFVAEAQEFGIEVLVDEARYQLQLTRGGSGRLSPPGRTSTEEQAVEDLLHPTERDRANTLAIYLARQAATLPLVRRFRMDVLGGIILSPEQAASLLLSPALQRLPRTEFARLGIPVVGHDAHILEEREDRTVEDAAGGPIIKYVYEVTLQIEW